MGPRNRPLIWSTNVRAIWRSCPPDAPWIMAACFFVARICSKVITHDPWRRSRKRRLVLKVHNACNHLALTAACINYRNHYMFISGMVHQGQGHGTVCTLAHTECYRKGEGNAYIADSVSTLLRGKNPQDPCMAYLYLLIYHKNKTVWLRKVHNYHLCPCSVCSPAHLTLWKPFVM